MQIVLNRRYGPVRMVKRAGPILANSLRARFGVPPLVPAPRKISGLLVQDSCVWPGGGMQERCAFHVEPDEKLHGPLEMRCTSCGRWLPIGRFWGNGVRNGRQLRRRRCWECCRGKSAANRARRAKVIEDHGPSRVTDRDIKRLNERQGWVCACGCGRSTRYEFHLDHRVPLSKGGRHAIENLRILAPICNLKLGNSMRF